ncbi:hypothetical protein ETB55_21930 [Salmonella enterica subsp. enterica serovar Omuna]|nr:hypothetical protein [Salmonella enterica subsp. enterica serovar Omuna]
MNTNQLTDERVHELALKFARDAFRLNGSPTGQALCDVVFALRELQERRRAAEKPFGYLEVFDFPRTTATLYPEKDQYAKMPLYSAPQIVPDSTAQAVLKRLAVIMSGSDSGGEITALTVTAQSLVDRCKKLAKLQDESRKLNTANLVNKFYERYPLITVSVDGKPCGKIDDTRRAEALGYFMAGAEIQYYGEFIVYEGDTDEQAD